jgi:hypothetical protein
MSYLCGFARKHQRIMMLMKKRVTVKTGVSQRRRKMDQTKKRKVMTMMTGSPPVI